MKPKSTLDSQILKKFQNLQYDKQKLESLALDPDIVNASLYSIKHPGEQKDKALTIKAKTLNKPILYVFRHGESYDNKNHVFSGWRDSDLTPKGIKQAQVLAEKLKSEHLDIAYTSKLIRAKKTLDIILKTHPDTKIIIDQRITERDYGDIAGLNKDNLYQFNTKLATAFRRSYDFPPPNGESLKDVEIRVIDFIKDLIPKMKQENINVAISCHGNSMRVIRRYFEKLSIKQMLLLENPLGIDYCSYSIN